MLLAAALAIANFTIYAQAILERFTWGLTLSAVHSSIAVYILVRLLRAIPSRAVMAVSVTAVSLILLTLMAAHGVTGTNLDFALVYENFDEMLTPEGWGVVTGSVPDALLVAAPIGLIAILGAAWRMRPQPLNRAELTAHALAYALLMVSPRSKTDDLSYFIKTAVAYFFPGGDSPRIDGFPLVSRNTLTGGLKRDGGPHVFIILVESFNANFVQKDAPGGQTYTPFYNELIAKGRYFPHFYGNSVQTARGHLAVLCGILPSYRGKIFKQYYNREMACLSDILRHHGYTSLFFKGFRSLHFDETERFVRRHRFDHAHGMDQNFITREDRAKMWGWGLQDDVFYQKFFGFVDGLEEKQKALPATERKRYFGVLTTVSNHMKFDRVPRDQRYIAPDASTPEEHYGNSIRVSDEYLREFFRQLESRPYLENSLVMVLGDHSYPVGEHGIYYNEVGHFEENFRIPFVMVWPGRLAPSIITTAADQTDIGPTVLDAAGITSWNNFIGHSLFSPRPDPVHVIQPYDGTHLGTIIWPHKYVRHLLSKNEFLYDLEADPREERNIIDERPEVLEKLREASQFIDESQQLLKGDRIWPGDHLL